MENNEIKESCKNVITEYLEIAKRYGLDTKEIQDSILQIDHFKIATPIIGGFSTGKSSLINAIVDKNLLSTQITPETAVPTEIYYGINNNVCLHTRNGFKNISIEAYKNLELNIEDTSIVTISYNNDFLKKIKDIKIVDMPGFDSGIDMHNKAIDSYLPNSLAYIITFSADECVIKESIANFLSELKVHDIPVYVVITKCDKVSEEKLEEAKNFIKNNVSKYLNKDNIKVVCSKSKKNRNVDEVENILLEIQSQSQEIFKKKFNSKIKKIKLYIEKYIVSRINNKDFGEDDLDEQERKLKDNLEQIKRNINEEKDRFHMQYKNFINSVEVKLEENLKKSECMLENLILNGSSIEEKVNLIIRQTISTSIKQDFKPKFQKYLENISDIVKINMPLGTDISISNFSIATDTMLKEMVVKSLPLILAAIGGIFGGPLGAILVSALGKFIEEIFKSKQANEKRKLVHTKLSGEIIPQVVTECIGCIELELNLYVDEVNKEIEREIDVQQQTIKKSIDDIRKQREMSNEIQQRELEELELNLQKVRELANGK